MIIFSHFSCLFSKAALTESSSNFDETGQMICRLDWFESPDYGFRTDLIELHRCSSCGGAPPQAPLKFTINILDWIFEHEIDNKEARRKSKYKLDGRKFD